MIEKFHFKRIWAFYFLIKIFYMVFAVLVFSKITTLGDTFDYLHAPIVFDPEVLYSSTPFMKFSGSIFKLIFRLDVLACIPFMMLSFYGIYYAIDRLNLYRYSVYVIILFSLPNFSVWTSIHGKEAIGCFATSIIAVIVLKTLYGKYWLKPIDYLALYLCFVFKPQYLLFILQALAYLWIVKKFADQKYFPLFFGILIIGLNLLALYFLRDLIDGLAKGMAIHFKANGPNLAQSTRSESPWLETNGFLHSAPYGMFIAFFGPTLSEMLQKPAQLLAGLESVAMLICFTLLTLPQLRYNLQFFRFNPKVFFVYTIIFIGILFVHYPFGFLNPGSAIRYRSNFYPMFIVMVMNLFAIVRKRLRHKKLNVDK